MSDIEIKWEGDLDDDCSAKCGPLSAHCELMGEFDTRETSDEVPMSCDYWFCAVYEANGEALFHSGTHGGFIVSGELARGICEAVIRARLSPPTASPALKKEGEGEG